MHVERIIGVERKKIEGRKRWVYHGILQNGAKVILRTSTREYRLAIEHDDTISRANNPEGSTAARFTFGNYSPTNCPANIRVHEIKEVCREA